MLSMVAMALSGFTEEKNALWRKTCTELRQSLEHPYLRAMFAFLASDKDSYDEVLVFIISCCHFKINLKFVINL